MVDMPRKARIDAAGALHHIIVRGINRRKIFFDDSDCDDFLDRLSGILSDSKTACFAWAFMTNHLHLLLRTGAAPIATAMRRLLTDYAVSFNRRHRRQGHLFQNRYKSILCQEDLYLKELVRYIHLNPLRAGIVGELKELAAYLYCGHRALMGKTEPGFQDADYILNLFGGKIPQARRRYLEFVKKGVAAGRRADLIGGGLVRSAGGWCALRAMRKAESRMKGDERILGQGGFCRDRIKSCPGEFGSEVCDPGSGLRLWMVDGSRDRFIRSYIQAVIDRRKATKNGKGSERVMLLGDAGAWDERGRDIEKTEHCVLDGKRIRDEGPANSRRARVEAFG